MFYLRTGNFFISHGFGLLNLVRVSTVCYMCLHGFGPVSAEDEASTTICVKFYISGIW